MTSYLALVEQDEGSAFGISFPDLPGCFSAADKADDILPNAIEALDFWFEDQPVVTPRPLTVITSEVGEALARGAFLIAVPHIRRSTRQRRVNLSLEAGTVEAIDAAAAQLGLTRSAFVAMAAMNEIRGAR